MSWIISLFRPRREAAEPFDFARNPYKARTRWPPDFEGLTEKERFRYEKKFRRRNKLKWARPGWTKFTKLTQWGLIFGFTTYSILFYDWQRQEGDPEPFEGVRSWYRRAADSLWTYSNSSLTAEDARRLRKQPHKPVE